MNKRIMYIDIYKCLLMILVIIGHLHYFDYNSKTLVLIYSFHMPAFLIISGILSNITNDTNALSIIKKRFKNSIVPYFVFNLISLILIPKDTNMEQRMAVLAIFRGMGDPDNSINLPLWFLTYHFFALTVFELLDLISIKIMSLSKIKDDHMIIKNLLLLIFCSVFMYLSYLYARVYKLERIPFNVEIALFSLLYVYIGKIIISYKDYFVSNEIIKKYKIILSIILFIIYMACTYIWYNLSLKNGRIDLNARDYKNALYMYINSLLGFIVLSPVPYIISKIKYLNKLFAFFGKISLYTLAYHIPSNIVSFGIINTFLPVTLLNYLFTANLFSISYFTIIALIFSAFMFFIHENIFVKKL